MSSYNPCFKRTLNVETPAFKIDLEIKYSRNVFKVCDFTFTKPGLGLVQGSILAGDLDSSPSYTIDNIEAAFKACIEAMRDNLGGVSEIQEI